jgi:hypothetical protein
MATLRLPAFMMMSPPVWSSTPTPLPTVAFPLPPMRRSVLVVVSEPPVTRSVPTSLSVPPRTTEPVLTAPCASSITAMPPLLICAESAVAEVGTTSPAQLVASVQLPGTSGVPSHTMVAPDALPVTAARAASPRHVRPAVRRRFGDTLKGECIFLSSEPWKRFRPQLCSLSW